MKRLLTPVAVAVAAVVLAACGGSSDGDSSASGSSSGGTATVSVKQIGDAGGVLVDSSGRALYAADQEAGGKVLCTGACNSFWTPLTVGSGSPSGSSVSGKLGVATRPDGTRQVTYNGKLLYSFSEDRPGQVTGEGLEDAFAGRQFTWHVVNAGGATNSSGGEAAPAGGRGGY